LLVILLAEYRDVGRDDIEQFKHDGADTAKMVFAKLAFQRLSDCGRRDERAKPLAVHLLRRGIENHRHAFAAEQRDVCVKRTRVTLVILMRAELSRVDEDGYRDDIGQCWPAGMPLIMTRVWPIAMIQLPTAIYMISHFMNSLRIVYLDGRTHTDPDIVVPTFNGESIGHWEDDTLVVDTRHFPGHNHWMDQGGAAIPASEQLRIIERIRMLDGGEQLEIEYIMTDPVNWEGEWRSTKRFNRVDDVDITEVTCFPAMNENLPATRSESLVN
jgi:hypothetical protein